MRAKRETQREPLAGYNDDYRRAFSRLEYQQRLLRLRRLMADAKIDVLNVSSPQGMCYLHGYETTWYGAQSPTNWVPSASTFVHVDHDDLLHFDDPLVEGLIAATSVVTDVAFVSWTNSASSRMTEMIKHLQGKNWLKPAATVAMELYSHVPSPAISLMYQEALRIRGFNVVDGTKLIRSVQKVKSPQELEYIRQATKLCEIGHRAIAESFHDGITEMELWGNALHAMYREGSESAALPQGVMAGPNCALHSIPSTRRIHTGELFHVDLCGVVRRYHGNLLRAYFTGDPPRDLEQQMADSAGAYPVLADAARPGRTVGSVVAELMRYYKSTASAKDFLYLLGYELGIAFPPDWLGEWNFLYIPDADTGPEGPERIFEAGTVTNFESMFRRPTPTRYQQIGSCDTIIYDNLKTEVLGTLPRSIISIA